MKKKKKWVLQFSRNYLSTFTWIVAAFIAYISKHGHPNPVSNEIFVYKTNNNNAPQSFRYYWFLPCLILKEMIAIYKNCRYDLRPLTFFDSSSHADQWMSHLKISFHNENRNVYSIYVTFLYVFPNVADLQNLPYNTDTYD